MVNQIFFFRAVPDYVFESPYFWLLLAVTITVILIRHNYKGRVKPDAMNRSLHYLSEGKGGSVIYKDDLSELKFYYEFGGGDCVVIIFIPNDENWKAETNRNIEDKNAIIEFIARQAIHDQVRGGTYKIEDDYINLYKG
jgi:hypothetical protein